jgi:RNA polymerase sigma factor (sigma-70 family)
MTIGDTFRHLGFHAANDPRPDAELVGRFVRSRDEPAFAELLRRHGPTVYGVCRRVLGNTHDADDAFQAVFLVLARKAETVRPPGMVGPWLYGVAVRTANKARVMNAKRKARETVAGTGNAVTGWDGTRSACDGVSEIIDAELASLPPVYRAVFVACEINGRSRSQAARDLGWPEGTVAARLAKARELLAARLTKRGVTLSAGLFAAAGVPPALAAGTLGAVREFLSAGVATSVAPAAHTLSDEVVKSMSGVKLKLLAVAALLAGLAAGTVLIASPGEKPGPRLERKAMTNAPVPKPAVDEWKEGKPIEFKDGGRVLSVAFAPSGKTFAVCRDEGRIDFFDPATRKHQQSMVLKHDPKVNPNTEVGTFPALAFRPRPHAKLGDVFAITHKNGVNIGTTNIGLLVDNAPVVNDLPQNWAVAGSDPHQVVWAGDGLVISNGEETRHRDPNGKEQGVRGWADRKHQPCVLAAIPDSESWLMQFDNDRKANDTTVWYWDAADIKQCRRLEGHQSRPVAAAVSQDGKRIVTGDEGGTLIVWEGEKFEEKRLIDLGKGVVQLALAPDGKTAAVAKVKVRIEDYGGGRPMPQEWHEWTVSVYDVDSAGTKPKPVYSWGGTVKAPTAGSPPGPASLAFAPDGNTLLAAFGDGTATPGGGSQMGDQNLKAALLVGRSVGVRVWERVPKK